MYVCIYVCMFQTTIDRLEVRISLFKRTIPLPVKMIHLMLILLNYYLKHLKRRRYAYAFHVNPLTHVDALSSITFNSTPYYSLCNAYFYSLWVYYLSYGIFQQWFTEFCRHTSTETLPSYVKGFPIGTQ